MPSSSGSISRRPREGVLPASIGFADEGRQGEVQHALLLCIDGFHAVDLVTFPC